jgi:hypothetical protein
MKSNSYLRVLVPGNQKGTQGVIAPKGGLRCPSFEPTFENRHLDK